MSMPTTIRMIANAGFIPGPAFSIARTSSQISIPSVEGCENTLRAFAPISAIESWAIQ